MTTTNQHPTTDQPPLTPLTPAQMLERRQIWTAIWYAVAYGPLALVGLFALGPFGPGEFADMQANWSTRAQVANIQREAKQKLAISDAEYTAQMQEIYREAARRLITRDCIPVTLTQNGEPLGTNIQPGMADIKVKPDPWGAPIYPEGTCVAMNGVTGLVQGTRIVGILPAPPQSFLDAAQLDKKKKVAPATESTLPST